MMPTIEPIQPSVKPNLKKHVFNSSDRPGDRHQCAPGPVSNTGLRLHTHEVSSGIDHLSVSIPCYPDKRDSQVEDLLNFLSAATGEEFDGELRYFTGGFQGYVSTNGITVKWATEDSIISDRWIFLILPGGICGAQSCERMSEICHALTYLKGQCTRIDFQTTVLNPPVTIEEIHGELLKGNWVSKSYEFTEVIGRKKAGKIKGYTLYIGSRKSQSFLRIYDKGLEEKTNEHNEKIRFEVELKGDLAQQAFSQFSQKTGEECAEMCRAAFLSRIDFRDIENARGKRSNYAKRFAWYAEIFEVAPCKWAVQKVKKSLERVKAWLYDTVSACLATVYEGIGPRDADGFITDILRHGEERMSSRHFGLLRQYRSACG